MKKTGTILDDFMASCNIERGKKGSNEESKEKGFYEKQKKLKKNCLMISSIFAATKSRGVYKLTLTLF